MTIPFPATAPGPWTTTAMIAAIVLTSTAGEVLTAAAMKSIGDLDDIRARAGMKGRHSRRRHLPAVLCGGGISGFVVLFPVICFEPSEFEPGGSGIGLADAGH